MKEWSKNFLGEFANPQFFSILIKSCDMSSAGERVDTTC